MGQNVERIRYTFFLGSTEEREKRVYGENVTKWTSMRTRSLLVVYDFPLRSFLLDGKEDFDIELDFT